MPRLVGRVFLHAAAASMMAYGYSSLEGLPVDPWIRSQYGGHFQFLTIQGLVIAWLTMVSALFSDLFPSIQVFRSFKRALFVVAMPPAVVISLIYWSLILAFPALILQVDHSGSVTSSSSNIPRTFRIPLRVDLALHASPALTLLADFVLFEHKYGNKGLVYGAPSATLLFAFWYGWWAERCAKFNGGTFPYPFLTDNSFEIRVVIYSGAAVLAFSSFWAINSFHPRGASND